MAVGLLPLVAAPASAAPPANDEPVGALPMQLGDRVVQDTSEATTNAQDEALNLGCGAPATAASVWYTYTPDQDREVVLDVTESEYSSGILVFAGTPSVDSVVGCGPGIVALRARAGKTYTIMVVADTGTSGGQLVLSLEKAPPEPRVNVSLAPRGVAFRGGAADLHGTYSCRNGELAAVSVTLFQRAGRLKIRGSFSTEIRCHGQRRRWSARVVSPVGTFARGRASARVHIFACGVITCRQDKAERDVQLAWATGPASRQPVTPPTTRPQRPRPLVEHQGHWSGVASSSASA
ncbi:hypothetical protein [Nocardioides sp. Soil805]|uniref:hypothetical protein n=1 Tax=Nocardioides sp. Soil805 TaxID=1736416 RepID=UPI0012E37920|nr:hypothetical protein [Nocardioides sp. Soil805]